MIELKNGTKIIFSREKLAHSYKLIKTEKLNWDIFKFYEHSLNLGRIDLCFSQPNDFYHISKSFDDFLVNSRSHIQKNTNSRHIRLQDFPDGKILKVNRRNNSLHYRVYQKNERVRFELELKHRKTKLVQDYLFQNKLDVFEDLLVMEYFKYSEKVLCIDYQYTDWILDFQRRSRVCQLVNSTSRSLTTSYLESQIIEQQEEEEKFFHLLQFLSFVKSLTLNPLKDCKKHSIKKQNYYGFKFLLSKFVHFTGIKISNHSDREKLIFYFCKLQKLDPIIKVFSSKAFRSYVFFPYVECKNPYGNYWVIEVLASEELFCFPYAFQLPKSFLCSTNKNDLWLKVRIIKSLAISSQEKTLDMEDFFNRISVPNSQLIIIKKSMIQLLNELVEVDIIQNEIKIVLKSGKETNQSIKDSTSYHITRRIKYIKFYEKIKIHRLI
uniref:hypothetical protein n=1 Tax=Haslea pseudostrearia TaxID=197756 RepID=UPI0022069E0D|nr:hypothetical protein ON958_pgp040 [Haslea pseudostrearia]UXN44660.1 hypothetical protein [Haslea pseudostrearia]